MNIYSILSALYELYLNFYYFANEIQYVSSQETQIINGHITLIDPTNIDFIYAPI